MIKTCCHGLIALAGYPDDERPSHPSRILLKKKKGEKRGEMFSDGGISEDEGGDRDNAGGHQRLFISIISRDHG